MMIKKSYGVKILWVIIFLYPLLFIWQGGDLTDTGFSAINYRFFFENLEEGNLHAQVLLTDAIGAFWTKLFPSFGVIGYNVLYLFFLYGLIYLIYKTLISFENQKTLILIGLICGMIFLTRSSILIFSYDICSAFFLYLVGFLFIKAVFTEKKFLFFLTGLFCGFAVLARIPNLLMVLMLPVVFILREWVNNREIFRKKIFIYLKLIIFYLLGFISFLILITISLQILGIESDFIHNLRALTNQDNGSSYTLSSLILLYLKEFVDFIPHLLIVSFLLLTGMLLNNFKTKINVIIALITFILLIIGLFIYTDYSYTSPIKYLLPAFCLPALLFSIIKRDQHSVFVYTFSLIALTQVAGTNTGLFYKLSYGLIGLTPIALLIYWNINKLYIKDISFNFRLFSIIGVCLIMLFSVKIRLGWIYHVTSGLRARTHAIYSIDHELMQGILTTKNRAQHIKKVTIAINNNIDKENSLIIYGHQPLFYYLTDRNPPVKKYWLANHVISPTNFFNSIESSVQKSGKWPLIVDTKDNILGTKGNEILLEFLINNKYNKIVDSKEFAIWKRN